MSETFDSKMEKCRILIYGVNSNESIKERIAAIYPQERLAQGEELYQQTKEAAANQSAEKFEGEEATSNFNKSKENIHDGLVRLRKAIRYFFKEELHIQQIMLMDKNIPTKYAEWKAFAENSFKAAQQETQIQEKLSLVNLPPEIIGNYLSEIANLEQLILIAEKEDGEAQQATQIKHENFEELKTYCSDLRECLGLFYSGRDRQKLEEVGIVVK